MYPANSGNAFGTAGVVFVPTENAALAAVPIANFFYSYSCWAPMLSHLISLRRTILPLLCLGLGGCVNGTREVSTQARRPAMPTMAPPPEKADNSLAEAEILARAVRAADNNDVEGTLRALRQVGDPARRSALAGELMARLHGTDPKLRAKLAVALGTEFNHMGAIDGAGRNLVQHDGEFAFHWAAGLQGSAASRRMSRAIVDELVGTDPNGTLDRIGKLPAGAVRDDLLVLAAGGWARRDPDAAISWLRERPDDPLKQRLTSGIGFDVAQVRPERAVAVAHMLPEGRDRRLLLAAIAETWVAIDLNAALAWAGELPADGARAAALSGIDNGLGVPLSRRVAAVAPGIRGGSSRTRGSGAAIAGTEEITSAAFAAWVSQQPRDLPREDAILEYIRQRGAVEPAAIGPLLETMPPGYKKDEAMQTYLDGLLISSPREAARWVNSLPRSERNDDLMAKTAQRLLLLNPEAGVEYLQQSTLPTYRKEEVLREGGR
jgi:hypothetical protein